MHYYPSIPYIAKLLKQQGLLDNTHYRKVALEHYIIKCLIIIGFVLLPAYCASHLVCLNNCPYIPESIFKLLRILAPIISITILPLGLIVMTYCYYKRKRFYLYNIGTPITGSINSIVRTSRGIFIDYSFSLKSDSYSASFFSYDATLKEADLIIIFYDQDTPEKNAYFAKNLQYLLVRNDNSLLSFNK